MCVSEFSIQEGGGWGNWWVSHVVKVRVIRLGLVKVSYGFG